MGKSSNTARQAELIAAETPAAPAAKPSAAAIMKGRGWWREGRPGNIVVWRFDDPCGDYFLIGAQGEWQSGPGLTTDADPAAPIWTGGRYFDAPEGVAPIATEVSDPAPLAEIVAEVLALPRLAPASAFSPLEALRNLVLFHDGDAYFLAANRSTIADMPFGETSFQESLWQVARDVCASNPPSTKEPRK